MLTTLVVLGIPAFGIAVILAFVFGRSRRRVGVVLAGGWLLLLTWVIVSFALASGDQPCHDCGLYLGRYLDPIAFFVWLLNGLGWTLGSLAGGALRGVTSS